MWVITSTLDIIGSVAVHLTAEDAFESVRLTYPESSYRIKINKGTSRHVVLVYTWNNEEEMQRGDEPFRCKRLEIKYHEVKNSPEMF